MSKTKEQAEIEELQQLPLIHENGSYNFSAFTGSNGTWKIISTVGPEEDAPFNQRNIPWYKRDAIYHPIDTFTNGKGSYIETSRLQVLIKQFNGEIHPVLSSYIRAAAPKVELIKTSPQKTKK